MKRIYLTAGSRHIKTVFGSEERVYSKADVLANPAAFAETEYVFSSWGMPAFDEEEIRKYLPKLKAIFYGAGSVQNFARPFLNCGVKVFSAWAANAIPVAEYTVAQIILANKGFFRSMHFTDYVTVQNSVRSNYRGNYGAKIGLIGIGMIGALVAQMLHNYHLEVLAFDPFLSDERAKELGVKKVSLETLFSECQVISNHLANNAQTVGMLNGALFEKMPPYATFLNTGRGAQVVEEELLQVLKTRTDLTAVLDVAVKEPPEEGSPIYTLENCILTPHIAGSFGDELRRMGAYMENEYKNFVNGEPCKYEVTLEMLKTMA